MTVKQIPVGNLACQRDTYLKKLSTYCLECSDKPDKKGFYHVKLQDTVLFPEGGGQPFDTGRINEVQVYNVQREKLAHVHFTKAPVPVNQPVVVTLDWERRWDHMQQHTGQHLLSAVLEQEPFLYPTSSWNLGLKRSYVELETKATKTVPTETQLKDVERRVNDLILKDLPVVTHTKKAGLVDRPDSLPEDYQGDDGHIRTVEIQGLDLNPCCGTHMSRLGHLQAVKILHTEKVRGGNIRVFFVFGQRVLDQLNEHYAIARQLTSLLSCPPESFVDNLSKLQLQSRSHHKQAKQWMTEVARSIAADIENQLQTKDTVSFYRSDADLDLLSAIASHLKERKTLDDTEKTVVLAAGEKTSGGPLLVLGGKPDVVDRLGKSLLKLLASDGLKGGGKGRWQGKTTSWQAVSKLEHLEKEDICE
ncbi:Threonyl/alanyl tRNA synthetase [Syncephalastrum racemosum]|uniref:Threonyl/alanyl tRNA synthetase n=1 Tax=Syncephalastrum racemosum TaxID=13706 RepID=A0A1X2HMK3_SYNRA|nr:Threonyl/alanyl tRNA synthetase [Syncephalastrum racemosum]